MNEALMIGSRRELFAGRALMDRMEGRRAITVAQGASVGLVSAIGSLRHDWSGDCSNGVLLTSQAGSTVYDRTFMETFIRPGPGSAFPSVGSCSPLLPLKSAKSFSDGIRTSDIVVSLSCAHNVDFLFRWTRAGDESGSTMMTPPS